MQALGSADTACCQRNDMHVVITLCAVCGGEKPQNSATTWINYDTGVCQKPLRSNLWLYLIMSLHVKNCAAVLLKPRLFSPNDSAYPSLHTCRTLLIQAQSNTAAPSGLASGRTPQHKASPGSLSCTPGTPPTAAQTNRPLRLIPCKDYSAAVQGRRQAASRQHSLLPVTP